MLSVVCGIGFAQTQPDKTTSASSDATDLKQYVGVYTFTEGFSKCTIELKNGDLYVEIDQHGQYRVVAQLPQADKFKSTSSYGTMFTFLRNDEKAINRLKVELMGQELIGTKQKP